MTKQTCILFPKTIALLREFGENLRLARLRRHVTAKLAAERAGISVATLTKIEQGAASVALGSYMQVLFTLGLAEDILLVAQDDELGRKLQDAGLALRKRAPKRGKP
ncbi:MAG: helix-turn-helix transcriptional regulator [Lentisphaerae bacterium]|nr:helix-turn-helix transcriptional regulator [Lentisphaerota bacterium]